MPKLLGQACPHEVRVIARDGHVDPRLPEPRHGVRLERGEQADPDVGRRTHVERDAIANEPRVTATVVQTVGAKGYDGWAVAVVA